MSFTYRQLGEIIKDMPDSQKDCDVTVHVKTKTGNVLLFNEEFLSINKLDFVNDQDNDVLDDQHPVLLIWPEGLEE